MYIGVHLYATGNNKKTQKPKRYVEKCLVMAYKDEAGDGPLITINLSNFRVNVYRNFETLR